MFDLEKAKAEIIARHNAQYHKQPDAPAEPNPEAGKRLSRLNAYKHGLTGQIHLFTPEEHEAFEKHCQSIVEALAPIGNLERQLAQSVAEDHWRLDRARAIEYGIFALGQLEDLPAPGERPEIDQFQLDQGMSQAKTWLGEGKQVQLLSLYQQRIQRSIERSMAELRTLRAERQAARQEAIDEAILLSQLAKSKGETYRAPAQFSSRHFVFSSAEIEPLIIRKQRLEQARALAKSRI